MIYPGVPNITMAKFALRYLQFITLVAVVLLIASFAQAGEVWTEFSTQAYGLGWCILIGVIAEAFSVDFKMGLPGQHARSSLAFLPFLCALTLFSTAAAVFVIAVVCLISQFGFRRKALWTGLFNVSQGIIAGFVASGVYYAISGGGPIVINAAFYVAFVSLALMFFLSNMLLTSVAFALMKNAPIVGVFQQVVGTGGANLWYDLLATPLALVPVILYKESAFTGMAVIMFPLLIVQYSYHSHQEVIKSSKDLLRTLVKAIETRDPYTSGHSLRVASLARAIGEDLGLQRRMLNQLDMAALLHDIGKIHAEFTSVLSKPYELSRDERALIETHAARGAELLREMQSSVPEIVISSVHHHHERFDGNGYPDKIGGMAIPLPARIIMLCDSIDAMLSDRPYRKALSIDEVRQELLRCSGTQFDPQIVAVVLEKNTLERAVRLVAADGGPTPLLRAMWA
jgi:CRISPR-associated endonuclease Cas3-HD